MSTGAVGGTSSSSSQKSSTTTDAYSKLKIGDFVKLLVTELQQQDPLSPMDNSKILDEVSQIQAIQSNQQLNTTLQAVQLGQAVATGNSLLGKNITALDSKGNTVTGAVAHVTVSQGQVQLRVGAQDIDLANVKEIDPAT